VVVREFELDLDAFEGPFDLLLTLVLKEELDLAEVDVAGIVLAFVERLAEREELDLEACGEFLVLVAALLELKARGLFPDEEAELSELEPEEAAEELARRLAEYRRAKEAAAWLAERLEAESDRFFRLGPAPLAPRPERRLAPQEPDSLAAALRALAVEPPSVSLAHLELRFPPWAAFGGGGFYGPLPIDLLAFVDTGVAWSKGQTADGRCAPFHVVFIIAEQDKSKRKRWELEEFSSTESNPPKTKPNPKRSAKRSRK